MIAVTTDLTVVARQRATRGAVQVKRGLGPRQDHCGRTVAASTKVTAL